MIWNHTDTSELKMKDLTEKQLIDYLENIKTETLLSYGVYQIEADGLNLFFEYVKGLMTQLWVCLLKILLDILSNTKMTKKFGIIGNPINHSLSPVLHNYWFKKYKIDASYSILEINDNQLPEIIEE